MTSAPMATVSARRLARLFGGATETPLTGAQALRAAADVLLNFMSLTRKQSVDHELAALRYLRLQELRIDPVTGRSGLQGAGLVPTRDISAVWASDLLRPTDMAVSRPVETRGLTSPAWYTHQQYRLLTSGRMFTKSDAGWLRTIFGGAATGVAVTPAIAKFDNDSDGILTEAERRLALGEWTTQYDATAQLWREHTGTRYRLPRVLPDGMEQPEPKPYLTSTMRDQISPERLEKLPQLLSGLRSQEKFSQRILNLGPAVVNNAWLKRAVERYAVFLALKAAHPGQTVVPTLDIDLIWHAHMLSPDDYIEDCELILGRVLPHDTGKGQGDLTKAFQETQELWRKQTGEDMVTTVKVDPKTKKVTNSSQRSSRSQQSFGYAACGSCGFDLDHVNLAHQHAEIAQIEAAHFSGEQLTWADESVGGDNWEERGDDHMSSVENEMGGRVYVEKLADSAGDWFSSGSDGGSDSSSSDCSSCSSCGGD